MDTLYELRIHIEKLCALFQRKIRKLGYYINFECVNTKTIICNNIKLLEACLQKLLFIEWLFIQLYANIDQSYNVQESTKKRVDKSHN